MRPVEFRSISGEEHMAMIRESRILALFLEVGEAYGLSVQSPEYLSREEKAALIRAARALPTRD